jgi:hypothetical protein
MLYNDGKSVLKGCGVIHESSQKHIWIRHLDQTYPSTGTQYICLNKLQLLSWYPSKNQKLARTKSNEGKQIL